jgi:hypothetical protein
MQAGRKCLAAAAGEPAGQRAGARGGRCSIGGQASGERERQGVERGAGAGYPRKLWIAVSEPVRRGWMGERRCGWAAATRTPRAAWKRRGPARGSVAGVWRGCRHAGRCSREAQAALVGAGERCGRLRSQRATMGQAGAVSAAVTREPTPTCRSRSRTHRRSRRRG